MHKVDTPKSRIDTTDTGIEQPKEVAIPRVLELISKLKDSKNPELTRLIVSIQTKLLQLQESGIQSVSGAIEVMLTELGEKPPISLSEVTRIFMSSSPATNDENYSLVA